MKFFNNLNFLQPFGFITFLNIMYDFVFFKKFKLLNPLFEEPLIIKKEKKKKYIPLIDVSGD